MTGVRVPELLNQLARAGPAGLPLRACQEPARELDMLRQAGIPLMVDCDRCFLVLNDDVMVPELLQREVALTAWKGMPVIGFLETGSTNEEAWALARRGARAGTVIYAEKQTSGKGRLGRTWFSPSGTGIYLSAILRPNRPMEFWPLLSLAASAALVAALVDMGREKSLPQILIESKWPNDVLISGKKTAGILVEAAQSGSDAFAIVGCGINVSAGSIPPGLEDQATAISVEFGIAVPRRYVAARFLSRLQNFCELFEAGENETILEKYKAASSIWKGVPIWVIDGNSRKPAVTCGLSRTGGLRVRMDSGEEETLLAAEVSVRRQF